MEDNQSTRIKGTFRHFDLPKIHVLHIEDEYEYLDPELMDMLTERINDILEIGGISE